jgi:hypothetical protein
MARAFLDDVPIMRWPCRQPKMGTFVNQNAPKMGGGRQAINMEVGK